MALKATLVTLVTAGVIFAGTTAPAAIAAPAAAASAPAAASTGATGINGVDIKAQGLINLILQVKDTLKDIRILNHVRSIRIITIDDSLNKLINHSDVLSHKVVVLHHFLRNCNVLACFVIHDFLNNNNVDIGDIVAIELLNNNNIRLFQRP
jgi:hypothetical protein